MNTPFDTKRKAVRTYKKRFVIALLSYLATTLIPLLLYLNWQVLYLWIIILIIFLVVEKKSLLFRAAPSSAYGYFGVNKLSVLLVLTIGVTAFSVYQISHQLGEKTEIVTGTDSAANYGVPNAVNQMPVIVAPSSPDSPSTPQTEADRPATASIASSESEDRIIGLDDLPPSPERNFLDSVKVLFVVGKEYEIRFPNSPLANIIQKIQLTTSEGSIYENYVYKLESNTWRFLDPGFINSPSQNIEMLMHIHAEGLEGKKLESGNIISRGDILVVQIHYPVGGILQLK